jgi:hypothetical protein
MKGAIQVARTVYQQESMFSHTAIVQSSYELPTGLVKEPPESRPKKVKMMHALTNLISHNLSQSPALISFLLAFSLFGAGSALAQNTSQALSQSELNRINNQPLAPAVSPGGVLGSPESRKPSFQHKESTGTEITEYKDANSPTQVQVKTKYTTYEMSPPDSVMPGPPSGEGGLLSVPSISIPIK